MVMGLPLVVPTDPAAIQQFRHTFKEMSISSDLRDVAPAAGTRLETRTAIRRCNPLGRPEDVPSRLNTGFSSGLSTLLTPV